MKYCTYDNPATMCRERWIDGQLKAHISANVISQKGIRGAPLSFGEPFKNGQVSGDIEAIAEDQRPK
jgi:hypothetical protein